MSWFYLLLAIILEVSGTTSMKLSQGSRVIKILSIGLIITGVVGLNLSGGGH
jgi:multidrug transporter EmrE-like cation transporter